MGSLNDQLIIARSGILSHQERLAVIGHNIANVNTDGYHRQIGLLATTPSNDPNLYHTRPYSLGTGVRVLDVVREYNFMRERSIMQQEAEFGLHEMLTKLLPDIESVVKEDGSADIATNLRNFWTAWQDVATYPDNLSMRNNLLEKSGALVSAFNRADSFLGDYRDAIATGAGTPADPFQGEIPDMVEDINAVAERLQTLNMDITRFERRGVNANDLKDQRDALIHDLSEKLNITVTPTYDITVNGQTLVSGDGSIRNTLSLMSSATLQFSLDGGGTTFAVDQGRLGGLVQTAEYTDTLRGNIDTMAAQLITAVNTVHTAGYDLDGNAGLSFFTGTGADDIAINSALYNPANPLLNNPQLVAAAQTLHDPGPPPVPNTGDGSNALAIADLYRSPLAALNDQTFGEFYGTLNTNLGMKIQTEADLAADGKMTINMLKEANLSESGVNLDEELVDMMTAQRAYQAAARMASEVNSMFDVILQM